MRVIGFDPGLRITGYGVVESNGRELSLVQAGVIRVEERKELGARLWDLYQGVSQVLEEGSAEQVAVEELYSHYRHPRTAILMGHARGVIFLACAQRGVEVFSYSAKRIKQALTGNGSASKLQVQRSIQAWLGLSGLPRPSDVADALAVALCHLSHQKDFRSKGN